MVKVFARIGNNQELPLGHSISGYDGHYLLYVDKDIIPDGSYPINCPIDKYEEPEKDINTAKYSVKECVEKQDNPNYEVCFNVSE